MARNRMIKPEFWEDDKIASLPFQTRLFFIALWNFADDEGYVEIREKWLKAKCFPYDDADIRRMIVELSSNDRAEVRGDILHIKNFLKHQRIDRPKESGLSAKFNLLNSDSTNDRRMIVEDSTTKRKLKEVKVSEAKIDTHTQGRLAAASCFGEEGMILLTATEYKKLRQKYGRHTDDYIQAVEDWKLKKKKNSYDNDYRGILTWIKNDLNSGKLQVTIDDLNDADFDSDKDYEQACANLLTE